MKAWLKGGLIGGIICPILFLLYNILYPLSNMGSSNFIEKLNSLIILFILGFGFGPVIFLFLMLFFLILGFIFGSIISLIIEKIKSKKQVSSKPRNIQSKVNDTSNKFYKLSFIGLIIEILMIIFIIFQSSLRFPIIRPYLLLLPFIIILISSIVSTIISFFKEKLSFIKKIIRLIILVLNVLFLLIMVWGIMLGGIG